MRCYIAALLNWGLRAYGTEPQVWGGRDDCEHDWGEAIAGKQRGGGTESSTLGEASGGNAISDDAQKRSIERSFHEGGESNFCRLCGAWRGELGLEPRPELFVAHLVEVFRAVRRVLRDDGVLFLNIGDSYSGYHGNSRVPDSEAPSNKRQTNPKRQIARRQTRRPSAVRPIWLMMRSRGPANTSPEPVWVIRYWSLRFA